MTLQQPIPNINIGQVYDQRYLEAEIHYESLGKLADFFGRNMPVHRHDRFFQVHYVLSGRVRVFLDDQRYEGRGPMFFLTPPTVPHAFITDAASGGHVLTVRQQLIWPLLEKQFGLGNGPFVKPVCVSLRDRTDAGQLDVLFDALRDEFLEERPGKYLALENLTRLVFIKLFRLSRAGRDQGATTRREDLSVFQRFNERIEAHFRDHWSLAEYADSLDVTEARLNDICRRIADLPSKRIVHERLMQESRRFLLFTNNSVTAICYELGFKDPAYFSRFFSRNAGMSPGEYRQRSAGRSWG
ncbi:4-hydroxyphenylacetate catabolism regulatory protein HpaA [Marinobacter halodurans]|uniref:4-hydroxyphenylacetate catabolism regulatory protein HpaA n=1 Tax=Marinobacter halodurans TaxID=2528979 RepID=A0ABY1ZQY1_9GAMM|nr:4-hydroxyphenylacetate catabolism regulatory protein HpaA [Marinobacter halodurans]TBW59535.1 4-hydroxyphenylacetate catabolism regulatory protein HpaA [Marinobacter halodurans]